MRTRKKALTAGASNPPPPGLDEWEHGWQSYWKHAGFTSYEVPISDEVEEAEREYHFLMTARTPRREMVRLRRIHDEFGRGFKAFHKLGPAVTVFGSARFRRNHPYCKLAEATGAELARAGLATLTGGGPGIMEAANRGAYKAGGLSYGLNISLPREQTANPYVHRSIEFHYFFVRKVMLVKYSCAFIVLPGGLGTMDELFEAATLIQCGKIGPFPLILMGSRFWDGLRRFGSYMIQQGVFSENEVGFGRITDSPQEAVELVVRSLPPVLLAQLNPVHPHADRSGTV
jgi:uncharacterized protein (TIGR00730 family)